MSSVRRETVRGREWVFGFGPVGCCQLGKSCQTDGRQGMERVCVCMNMRRPDAPRLLTYYVQWTRGEMRWASTWTGLSALGSAAAGPRRFRGSEAHGQRAPRRLRLRCSVPARPGPMSLAAKLHALFQTLPPLCCPWPPAPGRCDATRPLHQPWRSLCSSPPTPARSLLPLSSIH